MESHDGDYISLMYNCWDSIVLGVRSGLLSTESDVEDVASEHGFDVFWWGDKE